MSGCQSNNYGYGRILEERLNFRIRGEGDTQQEL